MEKTKVKVKFNSNEPETILEYVECLVRNGRNLVLEMEAEVQNTHIGLNRYSMEFPCLYAGMSYEINKLHTNVLILQNLGNIPTRFDWENMDTETVYAQFEPDQGVIPPKSDMIINLRLIPRKGGRFEELFVCNLEGMEYPLGEQIFIIYLTKQYHIYIG